MESRKHELNELCDAMFARVSPDDPRIKAGEVSLKKFLNKEFQEPINLDAQNSLGITMLILAAIKNYKGIAKLLIECKVNLDLTDFTGLTHSIMPLISIIQKLLISLLKPRRPLIFKISGGIQRFHTQLIVTILKSLKYY